jgi:hypothetical protein
VLHILGLAYELGYERRLVYEGRFTAERAADFIACATGDII